MPYNGVQGVQNMPHVILERDGVKMEAELSLAEIKDLMGLKSTNGHHPSAPRTDERIAAPLLADAPTANLSAEDKLEKFLLLTSDRGRKFVRVLKEHPDGIEAKVFAEKLGFTNPTQIGGLVGGGLAKTAEKSGLDLAKLYRKEITTPDGVRTVMFYPGKLLRSEKPA